MKINFEFGDRTDIENDLENIRKFKNRYVEVISGRRTINDDESELDRLGIIVDAENIIENLLYAIKEAEIKIN